MITAKANTEKTFKLAPEGSHIARCTMVIDLGTQKITWQGQDKEMRKIMLSFELPECQEVFDEAKGLQPFIIYKEFTLSLGEKANLKKFLESWRGKEFTEQELAGFDVEQLVDKTCLLQLIHKTSQAGNKRAEISSIMKCPAKMECPVPVNPLLKFSLETFNETDFNKLPEWIQNKIKLSPEYLQATNPQYKEVQHNGDSTNEDNLPF